MVSECPEPPVPPDVDLRGLEYMPLFGNHLFGSEFNGRCNDAEWRAGVTLWWAAWNQKPAGSLPNDDGVLCRLADLGRDMKRWVKIKMNAMRGFILCKDNRWYHFFLCKKVLVAWEIRVKARERQRLSREKRELKQGQSENVTRDNNVTSQVRHAYVTGTSHDKGKGREGKGREVKSLNPKTLNPKTLNPKTLNPTPDLPIAEIAAKPEDCGMGENSRGQNGKKKREQTTKTPTQEASLLLPDWLDLRLWTDWKAHRKALRAGVLTPQTEEKQLKALAKIHAAGRDPNAAIEHSIAQGWRGIFEPNGAKPKEKDGAEEYLSRFSNEEKEILGERDE